jgi:hypothetical protein
VVLMRRILMQTRKRFASISRQRIVKPDAIKSTFLDFVQIYKQDKP